MSDAVFDNLVLDEEEQWIEDHLEEFVSFEGADEMRRKMIEAAKNPPKIHYAEKENKKQVSMRLDSNDIDRLKVIAVEQGLPYQSLVGSVLHRYAMGTLVDVNEVKKVVALK